MGCLGLMPLPSLPASKGIAGSKSRGIEQPSLKHDLCADRSRFARQHQKDGLRNVLRQMRIADLPPGGGINQVHMPEHQFRKGVLCAGAGIFRE
jgi:hypothetical protein